MVSIDKRYYCDGIFHCDDHSDETTTHCLNKRFNCTAAGGATSISKNLVCDGIKDCSQGEDESRQLCGEKGFTAKVENQYQSIRSLFKMA